MFLTATAATEAAFDIKSLKDMMDGFDPSSLLPNVGNMVGFVLDLCAIAILVCPLILVALGLSYLLLAPKEANYYIGYRTTFGMGSVSAWRRTQKVAGVTFVVLGLVLLIVMFLIIPTLGGGDVMASVWRAVKCLIWEGSLTVLAILVINSVTALTFDYKGNRRKKKAKKSKQKDEFDF